MRVRACACVCVCVCVPSTKNYSVIEIGAKVRVLTGGIPAPPKAEEDDVASLAASEASPTAAPSVEELAARVRAEAEVCVCVCVYVCMCVCMYVWSVRL